LETHCARHEDISSSAQAVGPFLGATFLEEYTKRSVPES
jgi:hypothetical protein